jgi:transposase
MRPLGTAQQLEKRRLTAVKLLNAGHGYHTVAKKLKASISSLVRWMQSFRHGGTKRLAPKPTPGRPPGLTRQEKNHLRRLILKGAMEAGYQNEMWTLPRVAEQIRQHYGISYHPGHVWKILIGLKLSCQKPERRATQRDEKEIARWKREDWPRIKKRRTTWGASGFPRRKRLSGHSQRATNMGAVRTDSHH